MPGDIAVCAGRHVHYFGAVRRAVVVYSAYLVDSRQWGRRINRRVRLIDCLKELLSEFFCLKLLDSRLYVDWQIFLHFKL